jgi:toxin ParE1/3/4
VRIEFHPDADAEFAAAIEYFNRQSSGLGNRLYHEVMLRLEWIAKNSSIPRERGGHRRVNLKIFPFYIAYQVGLDLIWVVAIAHGHRKPDYWRERLTPR